MSDDPHAPTNAGPDPEEAVAAVESAEAQAADAPAEPTPVVPPSETSWRTPPGTAAADVPGSEDRPEIAVGLAFAGGVAAALLLKVVSR